MSSAIQQVQMVRPDSLADDALKTLTANVDATSVRCKKPRKKDILSQANPIAGAEDGFTVMIMGLPWTYKECDLLKLLDQVVGTGTFDFFYMPWDIQRNTNSGCAFVNFMSYANAMKCAALLNGQRFEGISKSIKPCMVVPAHVQGLVANLEYYRTRAVGAVKNAHAPMVFKNGARMHFHMAVKKFCPKKSAKGRTQTTSEDKTKTSANKSKKQPVMNMVEASETAPCMNFRPPPGLEHLSDFHPQEDLKDGPGLDGPIRVPVPPKEEEHIPMKVTPLFCRTHPEDLRIVSSQISGDCLFTPLCIFEDDSIRSRSDSGNFNTFDSKSCSTTASEDEGTMDGNHRQGLMYDCYKDQTRKDVLKEIAASRMQIHSMEQHVSVLLQQLNL